MAHPRDLPFAIPLAGWNAAITQSGYPTDFGGPGTPCPFPCPYCLRDIIRYLRSGASGFTLLQIANYVVNHANWLADTDWPPGSADFAFPTAGDFTAANVRTFVQNHF